MVGLKKVSPTIFIRKKVNTKIKQSFFILTTVVVCCLGLPAFLQAKPINFLASLKSYFQGQEDESVTDGLVQNRQMYNASWTPLLTRMMDFNANFGYSNNWVKDLGTREIINPTMQFTVKNDLFSLGLNGDIVQNNISFREDKKSSSWNSNLSSSWTNFLWPELSLRMGQRFEEVDKESFSRLAENTTYSYIGSSISWEGYKFRLFYDYNKSRNEEENSLDSTQQDVEGHLGKLEYGDSYWNNRVSLNFSQLVYDNTTDYSSTGGNPLIRVPVISAYSGVDVTPTLGTLPLNQRLIDGNKLSTAVSIQLQQPVNLALRTNFSSVDVLYVYTTRDDKLLVSNTGAVTWDLYTSADGVTWQLVKNNVSSSFNTVEFRFEVSVGTIRAEYMKLVATDWLSGLNIDVTEIEPFTFLAGTSAGNYEQNSRNYKTELYLGVNPLDNTRFNYTFSWDKNENSGTEESEVEQLIQTARLYWDYSQYFAPSAGFSSIVNKNDRPGANDTESRTYDLNVVSTPIPTIDLNFSYSWIEYFENEERERHGNHMSLSALAALYPDLSAELTVGYNQSQSDVTDEQSDGVFINFIMHSQLRKTLNVDLQTNYNFSNSDVIILAGGHSAHGSSTFESSSSESGETLLTVSWRPSDILSFSLRGYSLYGPETDTEYGGYFNTNYLVFRTSKTNLTLSYWLNAGSDKDTINNFGLVWGWDISNYFTLNTSGNYILAAEGDSWNFYTQITAKF